jgi:hypothetical protein
MVFVVLTRSALEEIEPRVVVGHDAVWVNAGVLPESEVSRLRGLGWDLTTWTSPLDPNEFCSEIETVRLHHPDQVIWAEAPAEQSKTLEP